MTNKEAVEIITQIEGIITNDNSWSYEAKVAVKEAFEIVIDVFKDRPQGEWIKQYGKSYELITDDGTFVGEFTKCPKCLYDKAIGSNFCPNCGADMRGE